MKAVLSYVKANLYHMVNGEAKEGVSSGLYGDCSGLSGNCSRLYGNCSGLSGNCSRLYGDCSGLSGNCSGLYGNCSRLYGDCSCLSGNCSGLSGNCSCLSGDFDECEISDEEREKGIEIKSLCQEEKTEPIKAKAVESIA